MSQNSDGSNSNESYDDNDSRLAIAHYKTTRSRSKSSVGYLSSTTTRSRSRSRSKSVSNSNNEDESSQSSSSGKKINKYILRKASDADFKYICEWNDCQQITNSMNEFNHHVTKHLLSYKQQLDLNIHQGSYHFDCQWQECNAVFEGQIEDICRHVFYHTFHQYLKFLGRHIQQTENLKSCALDTHSKNVIPELPERLMCRWQDCGLIYDNPYIFYSHVCHHCEDYNKEMDSFACRWEGCDVSKRFWYKMKEHIRSHTQAKVVACPTCGSLFANNTRYIDHLLRQGHVTEQKFECSHCGNRFGSERILRDHMRHHVNHYKCPMCNMTCHSPSAVREHVRYRHTEERSYHCDKCEHRAKTQTDLRRHMLVHQEERRLSCRRGCHMVFNTSDELRRHHATHGIKKQEFGCHICAERFTRANTLTKHLMEMHNYSWPSGHRKFKYVRHDDGIKRLQTIRYESIEVSKMVVNQVLASQQGNTSSGALCTVSPLTSAPKADNGPVATPSYQVQGSGVGPHIGTLLKVPQDCNLHGTRKRNTQMRRAKTGATTSSPDSPYKQKGRTTAPLKATFKRKRSTKKATASESKGEQTTSLEDENNELKPKRRKRDNKSRSVTEGTSGLNKRSNNRFTASTGTEENSTFTAIRVQATGSRQAEFKPVLGHIWSETLRNGTDQSSKFQFDSISSEGAVEGIDSLGTKIVLPADFHKAADILHSEIQNKNSCSSSFPPIRLAQSGGCSVVVNDQVSGHIVKAEPEEIWSGVVKQVLAKNKQFVTSASPRTVTVDHSGTTVVLPSDFYHSGDTSQSETQSWSVTMRSARDKTTAFSGNSLQTDWSSSSQSSPVKQEHMSHMTLTTATQSSLMTQIKPDARLYDKTRSELAANISMNLLKDPTSYSWASTNDLKGGELYNLEMLGEVALSAQGLATGK